MLCQGALFDMTRSISGEAMNEPRLTLMDPHALLIDDDGSVAWA